MSPKFFILSAVCYPWGLVHTALFSRSRCLQLGSSVVDGPMHIFGVPRSQELKKTMAFQTWGR